MKEFVNKSVLIEELEKRKKLHKKEYHDDCISDITYGRYIREIDKIIEITNNLAERMV